MCAGRRVRRRSSSWRYALPPITLASDCNGRRVRNVGWSAWILEFDAMTTFVLITDMVISVLLIVVAVPLLKNRVAPNGAYGVRIPKSLASPENWYVINRYGAKQLILWSGASLLAAIVGFFLPIEEASPLFWAYIFLPVVAALPACLLTLRFARRV